MKVYVTISPMAGHAAWGAGGLIFSSWEAGDGSIDRYCDIEQGFSVRMVCRIV